MIDLSRASAPDDGIARRTILAGAAWSIPVIATATVAPAASASGTLALAFNQASYTGTACSTITGAYVTATNSGSAAAGVPITVTLGSNATFSDGSSTTSGVSQSDGRFNLPGVVLSPRGDSTTMTALAAGTSVSAGVIGHSPAGAFGWLEYPTLAVHDAIGVPAGSVGVLGSWFLTPDQRLIAGDSGAVVATGIAAAGKTAYNGELGFTHTDGTFFCTKEDLGGYVTVGVPAGSTNVFGKLFLAPDGRLIAGDTGNDVTTNVATLGQNHWRGNITFTRLDGSFGWLEYPTLAVHDAIGVPAGSVGVLGSWFLTPDQRLIAGDSGAVVATGIAAAGKTAYNGELGFTHTDGTFFCTKEDLGGYVTVGVPAGSTNVFGKLFLAPDGRLIAGDTGNDVTTNVATLGQNHWRGNITFTRLANC